MKPKLLRVCPLFDPSVWSPPLSNEEKQPTLVESLLPVTPLGRLRRTSSDSLHDRWPNIPVGQSVGAHTKGSGEWIKNNGFLSTASLHVSCGFQFGSLIFWVSRCFQVGLQLWLVVYDFFFSSLWSPNVSTTGISKNGGIAVMDMEKETITNTTIIQTGIWKSMKYTLGLRASWFWEAPSL